MTHPVPPSSAAISDAPPLGRVALAWLFCLGGFGAFFPYASWYLSRTLGMTGSEVGVTMGTLPLVGIAAQPLWGYVADRTGRRTRILALLAIGTAAGYALVGSAGKSAVIFAMALHASFSSALIPNLWAVTMALLVHRGMRFIGFARVAGTLGFVVVAFAFPYLVDLSVTDSLANSVHEDGRGIRLLFPIASLCALFGAITIATLPRTGEVTERARAGQTRALLTDPRYLRLVAVTFLAFLCMQGPMALFPLLVHAQGGGIDAIGNMWVLMIALEVPLVAGFGWTVDRLGIARVVTIGAFAGAVRWLVSGYATSLDVAVAAQILHGVTVWGLILGLPALVETVVPPALRSTAQSVLAMVGIGLGAMASNALSGYLVDALDARAPARIGGIGALLLALLLPWILPRGVGARNPS